jgi:hypothetical protein
LTWRSTKRVIPISNMKLGSKNVRTGGLRQIRVVQWRNLALVLMWSASLAARYRMLACRLYPGCAGSRRMMSAGAAEDGAAWIDWFTDYVHHGLARGLHVAPLGVHSLLVMA